MGLDHALTDAAIYLPVGQEEVRTAYLLSSAEAGVAPASLVPDMRALVQRLDPDLALYAVDSLEGHIAAARGPIRAFAGLFLSFGAAGLLLATVGLFGLLSFTVRRRVRELGVRSALGAAPRQVMSSALASGLRPLGIGLLVGLGLAAAVTPSFEELLMRSSPRDPAVFGAVALTLIVTGILAAIMPARRVLAIDVVEALRSE